MLATRKLSLAALALAAMVAVQLSAAPVPGVKAGGEDGDKWLLDDAEVVMVLNFKQLYDSKLMKGGYTKMLQDKLKDDPKAKEFQEKTGLDITKDVDSIIISAGGTSKETAKGRIVFKGSFDVEKLSKTIKSSDKVTASKEGTAEVFAIEAQGGTMLYGAFANKNTFVMTESKDVTTGLAKDGPTRAAKLNKDVKTALGTFTGKEALAMVVVVTDELKKHSAIDKRVEAAVKSLTTVTLSVTAAEGVTVNLVGNTVDADSATKLEKQATGLKSVAELFVGSNESVPQVVKDAVEGIKIDKTRDSVKVTLPISKEMIEKLAKMAPGG